MKLLHIDSSARANSVTRQLTEAFVSAWKKERPDGEVVRRDLTTSPIPAISDEWVAAARTKPDQLTPSALDALALSDQLISELESANIVVIGAPMYNFTISASLKAWIDQIVRPGRTVQYGLQGQKGMLGGRKVVVLTSRGGTYSDGAHAGSDYQEPYLRRILGFIGLTEVTFIHAENQLQSDLAAPARNAAFSKISEFIRLTSSKTQ